MGLVVPLDRLPKEHVDVAVVGTGAAGESVAEQLFDAYPDVTIVLLERGDILTTTHINNYSIEPYFNPPSLHSQDEFRAKSIETFGQHPWEGAFKAEGILIWGIGGRTNVAGSHLRRFYEPDYHLWPEGPWPIDAEELDPYYALAELKRHVSLAHCDGPAQSWMKGELNPFNASPPPWGVDSATHNPDGVCRGYDSAVSRLWKRVIQDAIGCSLGKKRRLLVVPNAYCTAIKHDGGTRVVSLVCRDTQSGHLAEIEAEAYVLAASPIESARLILNSGFDSKSPVGRYLAEHIYLRGALAVPVPRRMCALNGLNVNLVIPPQGPSPEQRFQFEIRGSADPHGSGCLLLRLTGIAAMDPRPSNRVTLSATCDEFDVPKAHIDFSHSEFDKARIGVMHATMARIAEKLRGKFIHEPMVLGPGRSHHEAGTLRMGYDPSSSVTDLHGRMHYCDNLYVADASVMPSCGVANPMLSISAWGYRLADYICKSVLKKESVALL